MIPSNITPEHILQAIKDIERKGYPPKHESTKYDLIFDEKRYPPKYVISIANTYANGTPLDTSEFSGGELEANKFLKSRGFKIFRKTENDSREAEKGQFPARENQISLEYAHRMKIWKHLQEHYGSKNVNPDILREEYRIYRGAAGIWYDKERTASLSDDGNGITVSVLHTGKSYPDDIGDDWIIYHYPDTDRSENADKNEVNATKNSRKYHLPIFIITHSKLNEKM
jgi:hypothetical protein